MPGWDMFKPLFPALPRTSDVYADRLWGKDKGIATDPVGGLVAILAALIFLATVFLIVLSIETLPRLFSLLVSATGNVGVVAGFCGVLAVGVGASLFELRRRLRGVYAVLEIGFAFATVCIAVFRIDQQHDLGVWVAFAGAAYLVVRGLDNFQIAKTERAALLSRASAETAAPIEPVARVMGG